MAQRGAIILKVEYFSITCTVSRWRWKKLICNQLYDARKRAQNMPEHECACSHACANKQIVGTRGPRERRAALRFSKTFCDFFLFFLLYSTDVAPVVDPPPLSKPPQLTSAPSIPHSAKTTFPLQASPNPNNNNRNNNITPTTNNNNNNPQTQLLPRPDPPSNPIRHFRFNIGVQISDGR